MAIAVLIVEDEAIILRNTRTFLEDAGFSVFEALDADEAIAILTANPEIHILFTDIDMPGSMDGLKLSAFVRDRWPPVRIVVTSGKQAMKATDLPNGFVFFSKPYDMTSVATSMRELVG